MALSYTTCPACSYSAANKMPTASGLQTAQATCHGTATPHLDTYWTVSSWCAKEAYGKHKPQNRCSSNDNTTGSAKQPDVRQVTRATWDTRS